MAEALDEYARSLAFAEIALGQIRSLRQLALPRNYEIWYVYATGANPALNKALDETLARKGRLTEIDLSQIYEAHLSQARAADRIDKVGVHVVDEINDVMLAVGNALGLASSFGDQLATAEARLAAAEDRKQIAALIKELLQSTREMESANRILEDRLRASRDAIHHLQKNLEVIRAETFTDPLTGLGNRKYFDGAVTEAVSVAQIAKQPLSLLLFDIDHFKSFNDNYGHLTGDQVLRLVASALKQAISEQDVIARFGGEEFAVLLPNTAMLQAVGVADTIRRTVMSRELKKKSTGEILGRVTISIGVSALQPGDDINALIERADRCLYAAKRSGRNRVVCERDPEYASELSVQVA